MIDKISHKRLLAIHPEHLPAMRAAMDRAVTLLDDAMMEARGNALFNQMGHDRVYLEAIRRAVHEDYD